METEAIAPPMSTWEHYHEASLRDPLHLDVFFEQLPAINQAGDTDTIAAALHESVASLSTAPLDHQDAIAALRDLDFLVSSGVRHGLNPVRDVPGLEATLLALSGQVGTVPRGTVTTYAIANPTDSRRRTFTGDEREALFIDSVRDTSVALENALGQFEAQDPAVALASLDTSLDQAIRSVVSVMHNLSPDYFTHTLRPYFDPIEVNGQRYLGAGGAQLQFVALDYVLWGATENDPVYTSYFAENYDYLTPSQQALIGRLMAKNDGDTILKQIIVSGDRDSASAGLAALKKMKKFRYPHRKLARDNFKIRADGEVGSGSYTPDILDTLLWKTEQAITALEGVLEGE